MLQRISKIALLTALFALPVFGAKTEFHIYTYAFYTLSALSVILVSFDKLKEYRYVLIFLIGLGLLWQTKLMSAGLVGSDIHGEYYYAWKTLQNGYWDTAIKHSYNSSFFIAWLVPMISKYTGFTLYTIFQCFIPLVFACVPLVCLKIYENVLDKKQAFIAVAFFMFMPVYSLEIVSIAKQMISEVFMALAFLYLIKNKPYPAMVFIVLTVLAHYSMGMILLAMVAMFVVVRFVMQKIKKERTTMPNKALVGGIILVAIISCLYLGSVASGKALRDITATFRGQSSSLETFWDRILPEDTIEQPSYGHDVVIDVPTSTTPSSITMPSSSTTPSSTWFMGYVNNQEESIRGALGFDFAYSTVLGKAFRIIQWITQILLAVGAIYIVVRWKRYNTEYIALFAVALFILALTIFLPGFSYTLNATRLYHLTLIILSPALVAGGMLLFRNIKAVAIIVVVYFVFTSGAVFELAKVSDLTRLDLPYSYALSARRCDLTGLFNENDIAARDYAISNNLLPVYTDHWAAHLFYENLGDASLDYNYYPQGIRRIANMPGFALTLDLDKCYIFISSNAAESGMITNYLGAGIKERRTLESAGFTELIEGREIVWQKNGTTIYSKR